MAIRHEDLVERAEKLALALWSRTSAADEGPKPDEGKNQLSKAIEVARASGSIRVFENWLLYQASRGSGSGSKFWMQEVQHDGEKNTLAEALFEEIESLAHEYGDEKEEALVWFLGYFRRAVVAGDTLRRLKAQSA